jgi:hypothetical protein
MTQALTTDQFIRKCKEVHGNKYDYKKVVYTRTIDKVKILCRIHGYFEQQASSHISGRGCRECKKETLSNTHRMTQTEFIKRVKKIHGDTYGLQKTKYKSAHELVTLTCKKHGDFERYATDVILGKRGCPKCGMETRKIALSKSNNSYIKEAKAKWGNLYSYKMCSYTNSYTNVTITCKKHGDFEINPRAHISYGGCPRCRSTRYSQVAMLWLSQCEKELKIKIQHAGNGGEIYIPGTRFRVDGYHAESKTIFEFYGDAFHGNKKVYAKKDKCHPFNQEVTAVELYNRTIRREKKLKSLGYTVVSMWESDFYQQTNNRRCKY